MGNISAKMEHGVRRTNAVGMIGERGDQHAAEEILLAEVEMDAAASAEAEAAELNAMAFDNDGRRGEDD